MNSLRLSAYAKLNLTLDVLRRREDGYHDLRSVMQALALHDDVTVTLTEEETIVCRCGDIPGDESNLAVRAARAFFRETGLPPRGLALDVVKRIPAQAGLAGGSADAAAVLRALRELLAPQLSDETLARIGAGVGSDVPFCLRGGTALAEGRGERLTTLADAPRFFVVLCRPAFAVSTAALFSRLTLSALRGRPDTAGMLASIASGDGAGLAARVGNVLEQALPPAERTAVEVLKAALRAAGADAAAMTGSGSVVFGLFREEACAAAAAQALRPRCEQTDLTRFV